MYRSDYPAAISRNKKKTLIKKSTKTRHITEVDETVVDGYVYIYQDIDD